MIVLETSALVALYRQETGFEQLAETIVQADPRRMPAHVYLEFVMVTSRQAGARAWLDKFIADLRIVTAEIDGVTMRLAADAFFRFGKDAGHPAQLNFSDCLSYAVARHLNAPLLFKGNDFAHTDIESALSA